MFDWLGISPSAAVVLGWVLIAVGTVALISLCVWILKTVFFAGNNQKVIKPTKNETTKPKK